MMNELARQEALQAMGVPILLSRFQLPGAKPSLLLEPELVSNPTEQAQNQSSEALVEQQAPSITQTVVDSSSGESLAKSTMRSVSELFSNSAKEKRKTRTQVDLQAEAESLQHNQAINSNNKSIHEDQVEQGQLQQSAAMDKVTELEVKTSVINYQHFCIQLADLLVVIDPLQINPVDTHSGLSFDDETQQILVRFLHDIYTLTFNKKPDQITLNTFVWPPHKDLPSEVQQAPMAYSMEQSFLAELATKQDYQWVLVFSEGYVDALFPADDTNKQVLQHGVISTIHGKKSLHVPSVQAYWQQAHMKLALWQSLQQLLTCDQSEINNLVIK